MAKRRKLLKALLKEARASVERIHGEAVFWREMFEQERRLVERFIDQKHPKDSYKQGPIAAILDRMIAQDNGRERTEAAPDPEPESAERPWVPY